MVVGIPKEVKDHEARVGVTPAGAMALVEAGHKVLLETQAGVQSGFADSEYQDAGAEIAGEAGSGRADPSRSSSRWAPPARQAGAPRSSLATLPPRRTYPGE